MQRHFCLEHSGLVAWGKMPGRYTGMRRNTGPLLIAWLLLLSSIPALAGDINGCKYLVIVDLASDPYSIVKELREQGKAAGFSIASKLSEVPESDLLKACLMSGSWGRGTGNGELSVRILYATTGMAVGDAKASGSRTGSITSNVASSAKTVYSELGYTGYSDEVNRQIIQREYPPRPMFTTTEEEIKKGNSNNSIEGIWTDSDDHYRLGIVPASDDSGFDYVAVVLRSNSPVWQPNEIKAEIRHTISPVVFNCTYYLGNKKPADTTLTLEPEGILRGSISTGKTTIDLRLTRIWPKGSEETPAQ